jgi:hypothetical protein
MDRVLMFYHFENHKTAQAASSDEHLMRLRIHTLVCTGEAILLHHGAL